MRNAIKRAHEAREETAHELIAALSTELPSDRGAGRLATFRWLAEAWAPELSEEALALEEFLRNAGWSFVSEREVGDPVVGVLRLYERPDQQPHIEGQDENHSRLARPCPVGRRLRPNSFQRRR
jgi:hypothetical protein